MITKQEKKLTQAVTDRVLEVITNLGLVDTHQVTMHTSGGANFNVTAGRENSKSTFATLARHRTNVTISHFVPTGEHAMFPSDCGGGVHPVVALDQMTFSPRSGRWNRKTSAAPHEQANPLELLKSPSLGPK
jgi:hypothetical protein